MPVASTFTANERGYTSVDSIDPKTISERERARIERLFVTSVGDNGQLLVKARSTHIVGRVQVGNATLIAPPPFSSASFATLLCYSQNISFMKHILDRSSITSVAHASETDPFTTMVAYLTVNIAKTVLGRHVAKIYVPITERLHLLRGRILWNHNIGKHHSAGMTCKHYLLDTDNSLNRVVFEGLDLCRRILKNTAWESEAKKQVFIWRDLVTQRIRSFDEIDRAVLAIDRQTEHYRPLIALCRSLLLGSSPDDVFSGKDSPLQSMVFDLAILFEQFVTRLVTELATSLGFEVRAQLTDSRAFTDGANETYRSVRPDLLLLDNGIPIAVLDAKYKPRYVNLDESGYVAPAQRITNADLYQMLFYQSHLLARYQLQFPPQAIIVSPTISKESFPPALRFQSIRWSDVDPAATRGLSVRLFALDLPELLNVGIEDIRTISRSPAAQPLRNLIASLRPTAGVLHG
jgi:hypothetical protein